MSETEDSGSQHRPMESSERDSSAKQKGNYYGVKRVRRSVKHFLFGRAVSLVASFAVALFLVRELSILDYAAYTALSGLLILLMVLSNGGIERVIPRYFPILRQTGRENELRRFALQIFIVRVALVIAILLPVGLGAYWLFPLLSIEYSRQVNIAFLVYALGFALSLLVSRYLQALLLQRATMIGVSIEWLSKLATLIIWWLVFDELSLEAVVWIQGGAAFLGCTYMTLVFLNNLRSSEKKAFPDLMLDYAQVRDTAKHNYLQGILGVHTGPAAGKLISSYFLPPHLTAALGFSYAITNVLNRNLPAGLLLGILEPSVMAKYDETRSFQKIQTVMSVIFKANVIVLSPFVCWVLFSSSPFFAMITGGKYSEAPWIICILTILLMMDSHRQTLQMLVNAIEKSNWLVSSNLFSLVFLPLTLLLCAYLSVQGLLLGLWLIAFSRNVYLVRKLRRNGFDYRLDVSNIVLLIGLGLLSAGLGWLVGGLLVGLPGSLLAITVTVLVYFPLVYLFKPFLDGEKKIINGLLGRDLLT